MAESFASAQEAANKIASSPAPIGGLNAYDSLVAMPPTDALVMRNWWPQPYGCSIRKGYRQWATALPSAVHTVAAWASNNTGGKLFAWSGAGMYDITTSGPVGAPIVTGLTNAYWQTVNFTNAAGSRLIAVNGADDAIMYDSTGVSRIAEGTGPNDWNGLDPANVIQLTTHQHRLWATEVATSKGWYLLPDQFKGGWVSFDFGPLWIKGGYLQFLTTWTIDDGNGAEDHLVAVSSQGEAAVYGGTDPADDTKWFLVGVYNVGAPVSGRRAYAKVGGDLVLLTQQGAVSMAGMLVSTKVNETSNTVKSQKVQFLISDLVGQYSALSDWEMRYSPKHNMLFINVPSITSQGNVQLASNQIIDAWTTFVGMDASTWCVIGTQMYFGDYDGVVHEAWVGNSDKVLVNGTGGQPILAEVQQAYTYLGSPATQKQVGMYRPTFITNRAVVYNTEIFYDFVISDIPAYGVLLPIDGAFWNSALWNSSQWGGGDTVERIWVQAEGLGYAASFRMTIQSQAEVLWVATDYSYIGNLGLL